MKSIKFPSENINFGVSLTNPSKSAIIGFNKVALITIIHSEHVEQGYADMHYSYDTFLGEWKNYVLGKWSNTIGSKLSFSYVGSIAWIIRTYDPTHGSKNITIDKTEVRTVSTKGEQSY